MTRTRLAWGALGLAVVAVGIPRLVDALVLTEEERVESLLDAMESAFEAGDVEGILALVDPTVEVRGAMTLDGVEAVRRRLERTFERWDSVRAIRQDAVIEVEGDRARARLRGALRLARGEQSLPVGFECDVRLSVDAGGAWSVLRVDVTLRSAPW